MSTTWTAKGRRVTRATTGATYKGYAIATTHASQLPNSPEDGMLDEDITRLRAKWDQVDAMVSELEAAGEDMRVARQALKETTALLNYAEVLDRAGLDD